MNSATRGDKAFSLVAVYHDLDGSPCSCPGSLKGIQGLLQGEVVSDQWLGVQLARGNHLQGQRVAVGNHKNGSSLQWISLRYVVEMINEWDENSSKIPCNRVNSNLLHDQWGNGCEYEPLWASRPHPLL